MIAAAPMAASALLRRRLPEPGRFWIRHAPRSWPGPEGLWLDLAGARLRTTGAAAPRRLPDLAGLDLDDVLYLPAVPAPLHDSRLELIAALDAGGTPVLAQALPGEAPAPAGLAIYDLLRDLVAGKLEALADLPSGSCAVWPLIAGVTDSPESWERGTQLLASAGVAVVQPLLVEMEPSARRLLAEAAAHASYDRLFHGPAPAERAFSIVAHRAGLRPFLERPLPVRPPAPAPAGPAATSLGAPLTANRRAAGQLTLAGELWLRLGRDEAAGQQFLGAGRRLDQLSHDVATLAREGNLGLLDWLGARGRAVVEESLAGDRDSGLVTELLSEYLRPEPAP